MLDEGKAMLDFSRLDQLSFDCYGTLVDWQTGISGAVGEVLEARRMRVLEVGCHNHMEPLRVCPTPLVSHLLRRMDNFEQNLADDFQKFKDENRLAFAAIAKHLDVDLNPADTE